ALVDGKFLTLRVPYPMGYYGKGLDGRIDDANAGWKGKAIWTTFGTRAPFHAEGGKGTMSKVVKIQVRPDPLANSNDTSEAKGTGDTRATALCLLCCSALRDESDRGFRFGRERRITLIDGGRERRDRVPRGARSGPRKARLIDGPIDLEKPAVQSSRQELEDR